jgi:cytochrome c biogenesis protein CcmG/thiol:disulfide interchange protein DsbE
MTRRYSLKKTYLIPLICFITLGIFFARGLRLNPREIPSALLNQPAPSFSLPQLVDTDKQLTNKMFLGHVSLLHVWASWCSTCAAEHPFIMDLARTYHIPMYALDYKDDRQKALHFLSQYGNPYQAIGFDKDGTVSINFGVYGTPETFLIDSQGIIRYKHVGPMTQETWNNEILPLIRKFNNISGRIK